MILTTIGTEPRKARNHERHEKNTKDTKGGLQLVTESHTPSFRAFRGYVLFDISGTVPPDWPLSRTLYAECGGKAWRSDGAGIANVMLAPGAPGTQALQTGPLFMASFWTL